MLFDELLQEMKTSGDIYLSGTAGFWHPQPIQVTTKTPSHGDQEVKYIT